MKTNRWNRKRRSHRSGEAGQAMLFILLAMGLFLLGALCFAFDMSNMWFHRQAAQTAADAACAAGAMDILVDTQGGATSHQGFTLGTAYSCTTASTDSVCQYAAKNGYNSNNTFPGNQVSVSFPTTAANGAPPGVDDSTCTLCGAFPFIRVDIVDHVQTFFLGLLNGSTTKDLRAFSTCGVELATAPIPLIVLDPRSTDGATLSVQGTPTLSIYGGPQQSIQVNSSAAAAVNIGGSAQIDLSQGGPATPTPTGSDLGTYGGPTAAPGGFLPGTTGHWLYPDPPINDPFATVPAPAQPTNSPAIVSEIPGAHGCPVIGVASCDHYSPGYYPTGISLSGSGGPNARVSIFDPGIYYIVGSFHGGSNSCMRPSTDVGDGSGGTMFYFAGANSIDVTSNSGKKCPTDPTTFFNTTSGSGSIAFGAKCTAASTIPPNLPATLSGSILLGPCRAPTVTGPMCDPNCSLNYGDPLGTTDPLGEQRGFLFFQNRAKNANTNPKWQGGGQFLLSGTMYFHQCVTTGTDTGVNCSTASAYNDIVSLQGNPGSGTYILGQIVADQISLGGTAVLTMDLNPSSVFSILKASIFQ